MPLTALFVYTILISLWIGGLVRPIFGVMGYLIVFTLFNPYDWWVVATRQYLLRPSLVAVAFIIAGALLNAKKIDWTISRREFEFYLFLGLCWLSTFVFGTIVEAVNWQFVMKMTKLFVFIFFFIRIVSSLKDYKLVVWTFILCSIWLSYQAHLLTGSGRLDTIGGVDFGEANGFAAFMSISVVLLAFQMIRFPWIKQLPFVIAIAFMLNTIVLTESRAVFIGLFFAVPYVLFKAPTRKLKKTVLYTILGITLFFMLADTSFFNRMQTIGDHVVSTQANIIDMEKKVDRFDYWKTSIEIFKDYPLGIGVKNFEKIVQLYDPRNPGMDAHNTYVQCYSEIGILGIILFIVIIVETMMQIRRIRVSIKGKLCEDEVSFHLVTIGTMLVIYFTGYMMTHSNLYTEMLWILLAMPICLENATQKLLESENETILNLEESTS